MKLSDFKGLFNKEELKVEAVENPNGDYYVLKLKASHKINYRAGEHGVFKLPDNKVEGKKWRAFSVASSPKENVITIGTRTGKEVSSFKKHLINLKKGDRVAMTGPFGWFTLQDETSPMVLFAGGVGITPIRALLKEIEGNNNRRVEIVYSARDFYLFGEELKALAGKDNNINLTLTSKIPETQDALKKLAKELGNKAYYYVSGSPAVIKSTKDLLKGESIKGNRIINDPFYGY